VATIFLGIFLTLPAHIDCCPAEKVLISSATGLIEFLAKFIKPLLPGCIS
jgi:hypothetical protein